MLDCSQHSDTDIVALISNWDIDAYYCVVEKYEQKLMKYILRITSVDKEDAENILQEVFIKAYRNINSYNAKYSFSSWIYRIAHNHSLDFYRKYKNKLKVSLDWDDEEYWGLLNMFDSWENIEANMVSKELIWKIKAILQTLDLKYKDILILKFLEEKNYDEISDILKIPTWTVATLINRWKQQFRVRAEVQGLKDYL